MYLHDTLYLQAIVILILKFFIIHWEILNYNFYHSKIYEFSVFKLITYIPLILLSVKYRNTINEKEI